MDPTALMVLAAMEAWAPPAAPRDVARYETIAADIAEVAYDPAEASVFDGPNGRARTALLLASTALEESSYRADIDNGTVRGDNGRSVCLMQVWIEEQTREGWTANDVIKDRHKCIRAALHKVHASISSCQHLEEGDRLGGYTHGKCVRKNRVGRSRWRRALAWPLPEPGAES